MRLAILLSSVSLSFLISSALARVAPRKIEPHGDHGVAATLPVAVKPWMPGSVTLDNRADRAIACAATSDTEILPVPATDNLIEIIFCVSKLEVGVGWEGLLVTHHDGVANRNETVLLKTSGSQLLLLIQLLKKHTNDNGFWADIELFSRERGLKIGYGPTGKQVNRKGWKPKISYNSDCRAGNVVEACQRQFDFKAHAGTGSYYELHTSPVGGFVPSLLS